MCRKLLSVLGVVCLSAFFLGCATKEGEVKKDEASVEQHKKIGKALDKFNKEDIHGVYDESKSGKDYTPSR